MPFIFVNLGPMNGRMNFRQSCVTNVDLPFHFETNRIRPFQINLEWGHKKFELSSKSGQIWCYGEHNVTSLS